MVETVGADNQKETHMGDTGKKDKDKHRKQEVDRKAQEAKRKQELKQVKKTL